jgi:hypothetical protein
MLVISMETSHQVLLRNDVAFISFLTDLVGEIFDLVLVGPDQGLQLPLPLALLLLCALCATKKAELEGEFCVL